MDDEESSGKAPPDESEERYRMLADSTFEGIVIHRDGVILDANRRIEEISGYERERLVGRNFFDLLTDESRAVVARNVQEGIEGPYEVQAIGPDGNIIELEVMGKEIPYKGRIARVASARDIGERKRQERALRESEAKYRLLAENVEDIIFTIGQDLTFDYLSPSFERLTGYTEDELRSMGWQGLFTPGSLERILDSVDEDVLGIAQGSEATERSLTLEAEMLTKAGRTVWIEVKVSGILNEAGRVEEILGVARDVTERKRTQERFLEEKRRAELYLDLFGHDIRNINQGIMSYLELLLMERDLDGTDADYIRNVLEQATRINDLVAKVQRLTHLRTDEITIEDVDARKLIQGAIDYVKAKYPERDIVVMATERCEDHLVRGSHMLRDVFISIIENAVRFDRHEAIEIDISCEKADDGEHVRFAISDRGPGMPDEMKAVIFKRLDQPKGGVKGTGLGLTVVWEIIKRSGGRIWVEDRVGGDPGQGSRFVFELSLGAKKG